MSSLLLYKVENSKSKEKLLNEWVLFKPLTGIDVYMQREEVLSTLIAAPSL